MTDITKLIQSVEEEKKQKVSAGIYTSGNPDQSAKIYSLAEQKKLPFEYVQRHYDRVNKPDVSSIAPILSRLLEDRRKAEMAYDDIDNLNWWEQVGRETVNIGRTAKASLFGFAGSGYGVLQSASDAAANITDVLVPDDQEQYNPFRKLGQFFGKTAQGQFQVAGESRVKAEETNLNLAVLGGVESAFTQIPGLTAGLLSRNPNLALGVMGSVTYGQSYSQAKESGLDDMTALSYAVNQSIAEVVTERIPAFRLLEDLGKNAGLTKTLMAQLATEIPSEQVATIWQDVNEWAYLNPDKTLNEFVAERPEAAVNTLISTIVASGLQTSALYSVNKLANDQQQTIETLQVKAKESKLNGRASQVFQDHVQEVIEGDIFIDASQVRELYQGLKDDSFKQLIDRQLDEAEAVGGDIVIPVGKFVSDVANSPNYEVLKEHFRLSPDKGTQDVAGFVAEAEKQIELKTRADEIYKEVSQQLIDTGRMTPKNAKISASIIPAYVTTKAARTGKSVDEIYNMMGLKIVGPDVDLGGRVFEQPAYKDAPIVFDEVKDKFLEVLPEDADIADVLSNIDGFSPQQRNFIKALDRDNWLGFDSPAQAISAALSGDINDFDPSVGLKQSIGKLVNAPYTLYQAKTEGFEGDNPVEANEWVRATQKGLDMSREARMARAQEMGFDVTQPWFHGTRQDFDAFDIEKTGSINEFIKDGIFFHSNRDDAEFYTAKEDNDFNERPGDSPRILEVFHSSQNPLVISTDENETNFYDKNQDSILVQVEDGGYDSVIVKGSDGDLKVVFDPANIRSINAAFDPEFQDSPKLLAQSEFSDIEARLQEKIDQDFDAAVEEYNSRPDALGGRVLNTDVARELSEDYLQDRSLSAQVHEPASQFIKDLYARKLQETPKPGEAPMVLFTAGGTGAGKTTAVNQYDDVNKYQIVYDTNMNGYESSKKKIEQALAANKEVFISMVYRDPVDALVNGALPRAMRQAKEFGSGRTVPIVEHIKTHKGAAETVVKLAQDYQNDDRVTFSVIDNSHGKNNAKLSDIEFLDSLDYTDIEGKVNAALESEYEKGNISREVYQGFKSDSRRAQENNRTRYAQGAEQSERRGQISILPDSLIIQLGKSSDLTTFLHEAGHLFLEMEARLYQEGDKDGQAILDWLGAESFESITTEQHEQWARGFEKYLGEGKAPSVELQSVFRRFASWMKQVYQSLVNLNVELTDDIRAVMDRLLASDEQIDRMKGDIAPLFESAEEAGATQAEFESYQNRSTSDIAKEKLREKLLGQLERQHKKWWKDETAVIAKKARKQFKEKPLYAAIEYMRGGDNSAKAKSLGSQIETLESDLNKLSRRHPTFKKLLTKAGGINRLEAAESGVDQANFRGQTKLFPTKGGLSFDGIREVLGQEGVQVEDVTSFINGILKEDRFVDAEVQAKAEELSNQIDKLAKRLDKVGENKLNTAEVEAHFFGKPPGRFIGLTSKTGSDADVIAARFGIASGADLIDQINTQPTFKQAVDAFVEQEMVNRHGDALKDGTLESLAEQAVHNVEYAKKLSAELTFLSRKTKTPTIDREQLKEYAKSKIGMMRHSEIYPNQYRSAELRAARKAVEAKTKKDFSAAQRFKQQELVNFYLAKEAQEALDRADRIRSSLKSIQTKKYDSTKYHNEVVNQAKVIISAYDFRKNSKEAREIAQARIESVRTWIRSQNVDPDTITSFVDAEVLGKVIPYKDMTVNDLQGLDDVVKSMMFAAKKSNEAEYKQDIESGRQWLSENRIDNYKTEIDSDTPWHQAKNTIRGLFASLRKMESLVRQADGMKEQGWLWKRTIKPLLDAENRALAMRTQAHKDMNQIFKGFESAFNGFKDRREFTLGSGETITMSYGARLSMALNMGNADNLEALRNMGRLTQDHKPYMTQNDIDNIVSTLNDSDWDLVQNIWDYVDTYWKEISELEIKRSGVAPKKVEAQPFVTPTGKEMKGGYYPLVGDPIEDPKQQDQDITTEAKEMMAGGTARKTTKHGSTIERTGFGGKKINFSIDVLFQHLDGVIHDVTHWQAVKDVDRLLRNPKIYSELTESLGKPGARVLKDRLKEIAAGPQKVNGLTGWERFFRHARLAATYNALGYSVRTSVMNLIGVTTAIADMDAATVGVGVAEYWSGKSKSDELILSKSAYMRDRGQVLNRDIATIRNGLKGDTRWNKVKDNAFWLMTQTDKAITRPIWIAAYRKGETMFDTEEAAIDYADRMVARTQGSGLNLDLSNVETRNEFVKSMTVMFSAMNAIYNITVEQFKRHKGKGITVNIPYTDKSVRLPTVNNPLKLAERMAWLMVVPAIFEMLLKGDEEPEEMIKSVPEEVIYYSLGLLPVGRDAASSIKYSNVFPPPAVQLVLAPVKLGKEIYEATQGEGDTKQFLRALTDTLSWGLVPGGAQFNRTTGYLMEIDGEFNPYSFLVTGKDYGGD